MNNRTHLGWWLSCMCLAPQLLQLLIAPQVTPAAVLCISGTVRGRRLSWGRR